MPEISVQKDARNLTHLEDCESFGEPIGALPRQTNAGFLRESASRDKCTLARGSAKKGP